MELIDFMVKHPGCLCYWIVPKYKHLIPVSEIIREWLPSEIVKQEFHLQRTFRYIRLKNESQVWFHSSEDPDSLRGPGLDFVILEEAAQLKENVWWEIIKPQLWDTKGRCLMISTPKGKNWLYEEFLRAKEDNDYACWQRPSSENPYLPKGEIERYEETLPRDIFRQEFLAQFIEGAGTVFRGVENCFSDPLSSELFSINEYSDGMKIISKMRDLHGPHHIGVDLGRHQDFTVFIALDPSGYLVGFERFRELDWPIQKARLKSFIQKFPNARVTIDKTGLGDVFFSELSQEEIFLEGITLTLPTKRELITRLSMAIDERKIRGPRIPILIDELEAFSYYITRSGNIVYSAPSGFHDDCVISLALAIYHYSPIVSDWLITKGKGLMEKTL